MRKKKLTKRKVSKKKVSKRKRNPSFVEGAFYEIETKDNQRMRIKVLETDVEDSTGKKFIIVEFFGRGDPDGEPISYNYIVKSKPIYQLDYYYKPSIENITRKRNPLSLTDIIDYEDYEIRGSWNDATQMWTCKECGRKPSKSMDIKRERPAYIKHVENCPIKQKQDLLMGQ